RSLADDAIGIERVRARSGVHLAVVVDARTAVSADAGDAVLAAELRHKRDAARVQRLRTHAVVVAAILVLDADAAQVRLPVAGVVRRIADTDPLPQLAVD